MIEHLLNIYNVIYTKSKRTKNTRYQLPCSGTPEHPGLSRTRRPFPTRSGPGRCNRQYTIK